MRIEFKCCVVLLLMVQVLMPAWSQQRSVQEVLDIVASSARPQMAGALKSKSFGQQVAALQPSSQLIGSLVPKGAAVKMDNANEAFYVYAPGEGQGFMIVSADERMSPVLGYCDKGDFSVADMPDNVKAWLLNYVAEAQRLSSQIGGANATGGKNAILASEPAVGPLLTTTWGQDKPYNDLCPIYDGSEKAVTGCVATAMAQAMYYYKYPTVGKGSNSYTSEQHSIYLSQDFSTASFKWDLMRESYIGAAATAAEKQAVAELMYNCGVAVNMDYGSSSGSDQARQVKALATNFGYDADMFIIHKDYMSLDGWHSKLQAELNQLRPLMISGVTPSGYGHAFIIDGYTPDGEDYPYYHLNWGWGGAYNGDFKMTNMSDNGNPNDAYTQSLSAIINFKPDDGVLELPNYFQAHTVQPESNRVDLTAGEKLIINYDTIINCANTYFTGEVAFYLVDGEGQRTKVYSINLLNMPTSRFTFGKATCNVPGDLESGDYTLEVCATATDNGIECPVSLGVSPGVISIINDNSVYYPEIMSTKVSVATSGADNQKLALSATNIMNFAPTSFSGILQMVYGDYYGGIFGSFGDTFTISDLQQYGYYPTTMTFEGRLPGGLSDGAYKCYLGAQQEGFCSWGIVTGYTLEGGYIMSTGTDASTKFWVKDGTLTLTAPYERGDANSDNNINVADLSALVRLILDDHKVHDFIFYASDMNEDAHLDVGDYSQLANLILSGASSKRFSAASRLFGEEIESSNGLVEIEMEQVAEDEYSLAISLHNEAADYNALQFDLSLPAGIELAEQPVSLAKRARGFRTHIANDRVLICNLADKDFEGEDGAVAYVKLKSTGAVNVTNQPLALTDIVLSGSEACEAFSVKDVAISADELTGMDNAMATVNIQITQTGNAVTLCADRPCTVKVASIAGQLVRTLQLSAGTSATLQLPAGVYVINNTKIIVK